MIAPTMASNANALRGLFHSAWLMADWSAAAGGAPGPPGGRPRSYFRHAPAQPHRHAQTNAKHQEYEDGIKPRHAGHKLLCPGKKKLAGNGILRYGVKYMDSDGPAAEGQITHRPAAQGDGRDGPAAERRHQGNGQSAKGDEAEGATAKGKNTDSHPPKANPAHGHAAEGNDALRPAADAMIPFATSARPVRGSMPIATCSKGRPKSMVLDRYSIPWLHHMLCERPMAARRLALPQSSPPSS